MERVAVSWSGGKESALALAEVRDRSVMEVVGLLSTLDAETGRTSVHGVESGLLERQAEALDLPLWTFEVPRRGDEEAETAYRTRFRSLLADCYADLGDRGVDRLIVGDIALEDPVNYRKAAMDETGLESYTPLLGLSPGQTFERVLETGIEARVCCLDAARVDEDLLGDRVDRELAGRLPPDVDPCGEDGEYHTFVTDAPGFAEPVRVAVAGRRRATVGDYEKVYADLRPVEDGSAGSSGGG